MTKDNNTISVALCTYNGEKYLAAQLDSILSQTYPIYEIVIVDDRSTDGTMDIVRSYAEKYPIIKYSVNEQNLGYLQNFSLAISKTIGQYVALSDQDDIWSKDHLDKLISGIGNKALCVGDCEMIDSNGERLGKMFSDVKKNFYIPQSDVAKAYRIVYNTNPYQGASMLIDRDWVQRFLPIPSGAGFHDTYFAGCACLTQGLSVIPDVINQFRIHRGQVTSQWEVSLYNEIHHRHHFICYPSKVVLINSVKKNAGHLASDALQFIREFEEILSLDAQKKQFKTLKMKNLHYREIYSCKTYKHILIRSLHFLLAL